MTDPTTICPGCSQYVGACMCHPARFDRVTRQPDGTFQHSYRGQPVAIGERAQGGLTDAGDISTAIVDHVYQHVGFKDRAELIAEVRAILARQSTLGSAPQSARWECTKCHALQRDGWTECDECGGCQFARVAAPQEQAAGRAVDALRNIRDVAYFDSTANGGVYYSKAENALAAIEGRDAKPKPEVAAPVAAERDDIDKLRSLLEREFDCYRTAAGVIPWAVNALLDNSPHRAPVSAERTGVPEVARDALLGQAELMERHFGLSERLEVAYVADTLRVAAGAAPKHEGRGAGTAVTATDLLVALSDLERAAKAGPANPDTVRGLASKIRAALLNGRYGQTPVD